MKNAYLSELFTHGKHNQSNSQVVLALPIKELNNTQKTLQWKPQWECRDSYQTVSTSCWEYLNSCNLRYEWADKAIYYIPFKPI